MDLLDTTFIIPVRIDSSDRWRNLLTSISYLRKHTKTNIYLIEHDREPRIPEQLAKSMSYTFLQSNDPLFYKTLCINDAFSFTNTPYIAIYDADVLIPLDQIQKTMDQLRSGKAQMVYPYDGKFLDVPEQFIPSIVNSLSVDGIDESICTRGYGMPEVTPDRQSFGGAVFFERKSFINGGMANQHLVSYGPEDCEFYVRFKKLGYTITRIDGPVYHLHHARGMNSTEQHHMVQHNHSEFKKIMEMDNTVLKFFVSSWPWTKGVV